jgi:hypothetical protein
MTHKAELETLTRIIYTAETKEQFKSCAYFSRSHYSIAHIATDDVITCRHRSGVHCRHHKVIAEFNKS